MSTTDELLEQLEAEAVSSSVENRFIVDNNLRTITVPGSITVLGVEHDDDVHRLYFQMPKMYGEFDLSEFDIRINYMNAADKPDTYPVDDKETSGDNITFSWLVGRTAFEKMGDVKFNICLRKTNGDGVVVKEFNTTIATLPPVLEGLEATELIVQQNPDIIESILQRLGVLEGNGGGTSDYSDLENKPQLNGITLEGNKTLEDVGAQPKGNYLTSETDPTVPQWAKNPTKPTYTATEVGADSSGTAESKVLTHNTADDAHNDIRLLIQGLTTRLNTLADSDDDTLDQMSEIVDYIKSNKSLIDGITTGKVNVSDIVNNLTTNASNKPLSAAQGVALKALIDEITVPEKLPNPHKLIFTGAVTDEYDGSVEKSIEIPRGESSEQWERIQDFTIESDCATATYNVDLGGNPFSLRKAVLILILKPVAFTNDDDNYNGTMCGVSLWGNNPWFSPIHLAGIGKSFTAEYVTRTLALEKVDNFIYAYNYTRSYNSGSMPHSQGYYDGNTQFINISTATVDNEAPIVMNMISVGSYRKSLGAGSRFVLYGIKEAL